MTHSYTLHWTEHQASLASAVVDCSPDVTLVCDDTQVPANRIVLSACSTLFYSLLKEETLSPIIISLPDTNPDHLNSLLSFLHTGRMEATTDNLDQVLATAHHLQLKCFSPKITNSSKKVPLPVPTSFPGDEEFNFFDLNLFDSTNQKASNSEQTMWLPYNNVEVVNEDVYHKMRRKMMNTSLKKETDEGKTNWKCNICGKKWLATSDNNGRNARRHMDSHLNVRVKCRKCGQSLKSSESLNVHRSQYCKQKSQSQDGSHFQMDLSDSVEFDNVENETVRHLKGNDIDGDYMDEDNIEDMIVSVNPNEVNISHGKVTSAPMLEYEDKMKKLEMKMAKVDNEWYCLVCGKFWPNKGKCKRHMETHLVGISLPCLNCDKTFRNKILLKIHVKNCHGGSHKSTGELNNVEAQKTEDNLANINLNPTEENIVESNLVEKDNLIVKVDQTEVNNNGDSTVIREATMRELEDPIKELLSTKMTEVDGDWHCLVCGKLWPVKGACIRHMQSHLVGLNLSCENCGKMFKYKTSLQRHFSNCHGSLNNT